MIITLTNKLYGNKVLINTDYINWIIERDDCNEIKTNDGAIFRVVETIEQIKIMTKEK